MSVYCEISLTIIIFFLSLITGHHNVDLDASSSSSSTDFVTIPPGANPINGTKTYLRD